MLQSDSDGPHRRKARDVQEVDGRELSGQDILAVHYFSFIFQM